MKKNRFKTVKKKTFIAGGVVVQSYMLIKYIQGNHQDLS